MKTKALITGAIILIGSMAWVSALEAGNAHGHSSTKTMCFSACTKHYDANSTAFKECMDQCIKTGSAKI